MPTEDPPKEPDLEFEQVDSSQQYDILSLWEKYEDVAMHFNDLIMKVRVQALGAVAALSTLVGILAQDADKGVSWGFLTSIFFFLIIFWLAIWVLDFEYYNRLLHGAVDAILKLEKASKTSKTISKIELSTCIEAANFGHRTSIDKDTRSWREKFLTGRRAFYFIVMGALLAAFIFSGYHWWYGI